MDLLVTSHAVKLQLFFCRPNG